MLAPAGILLNIETGKDYFENIEKNLENESLIYSIHCTKTNECPVTIVTISNAKIEFPIGSFLRGAVYHIYIRKMIFDETKASFIGYKMKK